MVYKIENSEDLEKLPLTEDTTLELLCHHAKTLEEEYGKERVEGSDGGYVLFASPGTKEEELKAFEGALTLPEDMAEATDFNAEEAIKVDYSVKLPEFFSL